MPSYDSLVAGGVVVLEARVLSELSGDVRIVYFVTSAVGSEFVVAGPFEVFVSV